MLRREGAERERIWEKGKVSNGNVVNRRRLTSQKEIEKRENSKATSKRGGEPP